MAQTLRRILRQSRRVIENKTPLTAEQSVKPPWYRRTKKSRERWYASMIDDLERTHTYVNRHKERIIRGNFKPLTAYSNPRVNYRFLVGAGSVFTTTMGFIAGMGGVKLVEEIARLSEDPSPMSRNAKLLAIGIGGAAGTAASIIGAKYAGKKSGYTQGNKIKKLLQSRLYQASTVRPLKPAEIAHNERVVKELLTLLEQMGNRTNAAARTM